MSKMDIFCHLPSPYADGHDAHGKEPAKVTHHLCRQRADSWNSRACSNGADKCTSSTALREPWLVMRLPSRVADAPAQVALGLGQRRHAETHDFPYDKSSFSMES